MITARIGIGLVEVLSLDDGQMLREMGGIEWVPKGRRYIEVSGPRSAIKTLLGACEAPCDTWPASYIRSCRAAAKILRAALDEEVA
jgi:hypothetical protein